MRLHVKIDGQGYGAEMNGITLDEWKAMMRGLEDTAERVAIVAEIAADPQVIARAKRDAKAIRCAIAILGRIGRMMERTEAHGLGLARKDAHRPVYRFGPATEWKKQ